MQERHCYGRYECRHKHIEKMNQNGEMRAYSIKKINFKNMTETTAEVYVTWN